MTWSQCHVFAEVNGCAMEALGYTLLTGFFDGVTAEKTTQLNSERLSDLPLIFRSWE